MPSLTAGPGRTDSGTRGRRQARGMWAKTRGETAFERRWKTGGGRCVPEEREWAQRCRYAENARYAPAARLRIHTRVAPHEGDEQGAAHGPVRADAVRPRRVQ